MIRHVVLFAFKADASPAAFEEWRAGLDRMRGNIPGMLRLSHGADVVRGQRSFDYAIVADFETLADIDVYNDHPLHEPLKSFSFPNSESIHSVDFVIDPSIRDVKGDNDERHTSSGA